MKKSTTETTGEIKIDLAKKLEKLNQRSGEERKGPSAFEKIPRFRGDYANSYSAAIMFLNAGKDLENVKKYFPIPKFNEYSEKKIRQEIAAENKYKPEEIPAEIEKRLKEEALEITENDQRDIEEVNQLVVALNKEYEGSLEKISTNPSLPQEEKDEMKKSIIEKLTMVNIKVKGR